MASSEIRATLTLDCSGFTSALQAATANINKMTGQGTQQTKSLGTSFVNAGKQIQNVGVRATMAGGAIMTAFKPVASILTGGVKAAIDYEDAFAGVRKTVDASEPEYQKLSQAIRNMSKQMPESAEEIAGVMEIAGQLGIRGVDNLTKFTKTAVMLGDTTNLSANDASTSLARFLNITGSGTGTVDKLGSSLVYLGNNTATTEAEIMEMALRLAAAGKQVGMTDADILGMSATLSSLGLRADAGGSAFSKLMVNMEVACATGGEKLENFAKVAGMSASEFKTAYEKDATGAITAFLRGLNETEKNGGSAIAVLDAMGIKEVRLRDAILRAAAGVDQMEGNLKSANQAYNDNNALVEEAAKRYETMKSKLEIFKNKIHDIGISIGTAMMPYVSKLLDVGNKVLDWVSKLNPKLLGLVGIFGAVGVAVGGFLVVFGTIANAIGGAMTAISTIGTALSGVFAGISAPILAVVAAIGAFVAAIIYCWNNVDGFKEGVTSAFSRVYAVVSDVVQTVWSVIQSVWSQIKPFVTTVFVQGAELIGQAFLLILNTVVPIIESVWNTIKTAPGGRQGGAPAPVLQTPIYRNAA